MKRIQSLSWPRIKNETIRYIESFGFGFFLMTRNVCLAMGALVFASMIFGSVTRLFGWSEEDIESFFERRPNTALACVFAIMGVLGLGLLWQRKTSLQQIQDKYDRSQLTRKFAA